MKKICLSLGAIMMSGLVLASCSFSSSGTVSISKINSNKGNAVDSIDIKLSSTETLSISKDDEFKDVYAKISSKKMYTYYEYEEDSVKYAYKFNDTRKQNIKATNYLLSYFLADNYSMNYETSKSGDQYTYAKYDDKTISTESYRYSYRNSKVSTTVNKTTGKYNNTEIDEYGGSYTFAKDKSSYDIDFGTYSNETESINEKSSEKSEVGSSKDEQYRYLDKSSDTGEDIDKYYRGYNTDGEKFSYCVSSFFDYEMPNDIRLSDYFQYVDEFEDYYDLSFSLTDRCIILTGTSTITDSIIDYVNSETDESATETEIYNLIKEEADSSFKGSKLEFEVWIDYTQKSDNEDGISTLAVSYAKFSDNTKANIKDTYKEDDPKFEDSTLDEDYLKENVVGKEYTIKGTISTDLELVAETNYDYSKKIDNIKSKAKKNNIFDKVTMTCEEEDE